MKEKRFIIRKYVMAESAKQAIQRERRCPVDEVFVDEKQPSDNREESLIGFTTPQDEYWRGDEVIARRRK